MVGGDVSDLIHFDRNASSATVYKFSVKDSGSDETNSYLVSLQVAFWYVDWFGLSAVVLKSERGP